MQKYFTDIFENKKRFILQSTLLLNYFQNIPVFYEII